MKSNPVECNWNDRNALKVFQKRLSLIVQNNLEPGKYSLIINQNNVSYNQENTSNIKTMCYICHVYAYIYVISIIYNTNKNL